MHATQNSKMLFTQEDLKNTSTIKHNGHIVIADITCPDIEVLYVSGNITHLFIDNCHGNLNIIIYEGAKSLIVSNCTIDKIACEDEGIITQANFMNCRIADLRIASFGQLLVDDRSHIDEAELNGLLYIGVAGSCGWERVNELQIRKL